MPQDWDGVWKRLFRHLAEPALQILCGIEAGGATITDLPTEFTVKPRADVVFKIAPAAGDPLIVHLEVQASDTDDFELRMVQYWVAITAQYGQDPLQVVILPRGGRYTGRYRRGSLSLDYRVVDVTSLDPDTLLDTALAPLALGISPDPQRLVDAVVARIAATTADVDARAALVDLAMLGAGKELAATITDSLRRNQMSGVIERTAEGQALVARLTARLTTELTAKLTPEAVASDLRFVMVDRFGDSDELDAIAARLAGGGFPDGFRRIQAAQSLADLRT